MVWNDKEKEKRLCGSDLTQNPKRLSLAQPLPKQRRIEKVNVDEQCACALQPRRKGTIESQEILNAI